MNKEAIIREAFAFRRKLAILEYAKAIGNAAEAYRYFEVPKSTFYTFAGLSISGLGNALQL